MVRTSGIVVGSLLHEGNVPSGFLTTVKLPLIVVVVGTGVESKLVWG
ncbi:hypothetical protein [Spirosoma humi]